MQQRTNKCVSSVCVEVTQKEETEQYVHYWHLEDLLLFPSNPGGMVVVDRWWELLEKGEHSSSRSDFSVADGLSKWALIESGVFVGLFFLVVFLSDSNLRNRFHFWDRAREKFGSELTLERPDSAFLVASGKLSFVNLLWPLYYLVCVILTANQFWNAMEEFLIIVFLLCVCVCVSIGRYECAYVLDDGYTDETGKWDEKYWPDTHCI